MQHSIAYVCLCVRVAQHQTSHDTWHCQYLRLLPLQGVVRHDASKSSFKRKTSNSKVWSNKSSHTVNKKTETHFEVLSVNEALNCALVELRLHTCKCYIYYCGHYCWGGTFGNHTVSHWLQRVVLLSKALYHSYSVILCGLKVTYSWWFRAEQTNTLSAR